ncbi:major capsid protein [robinz microvirus RP_188]|nr:major capsid protein [robinz microvirus RP_188]
MVHRFSHNSHRQTPHRAGVSKQGVFANVPGPELQRSVFDRSHTHKTTFGSSHQNADKTWSDDPSMLIPIFVDETLPGDTLSLKMQSLVRMTTPLTPILDGLNIDFHAFFVPYRILWDNWTKFLGAQDKPNDVLPPSLPHLIWNKAASDNFSIYDYFGLPPDLNGDQPDWGQNIQSLPFRAYNKIWNYWFRDENLQDAVPEDFGDLDTQSYKLLPRGKRKDYFTSALPWTQKGGDVQIPLVDNKAEVDPNSHIEIGSDDSDGHLSIRTGDMPNEHALHLGQMINGESGLAIDGTGHRQGDPVTALQGKINPNSHLVVDLSFTGSSVNDIREAFQIQKFLERNARGGTRIKEIIKSHFGVTLSDSRIQWPEYLGGSTMPIGISAVPQTSSTDPTSPLGNLAAYSVNAGNLNFSKSFEEHGVVMILASVRQSYTYSQGVNRMFLRKGRFDFYWPEFSHLGEQPVYRAEVNAAVSQTNWRDPFGFQERYAEYRFLPDRASGLMRPQVSDNLAFWHLGQVLGGDDGIPDTLSAGFIEECPPVGRILAVPSQPHFLADFFFSIKSARCMPVYSAPGLVDHF